MPIRDDAKIEHTLKLAEAMLAAVDRNVTPLVSVLADLVDSARSSGKALLLLAQNDLGKDALAIARCLFECAITARYLRHPDGRSELDDYFLYPKAMRFSHSLWMRREGGKHCSHIDASLFTSAESDYSALQGRFDTKRGKPRTRWSRGTIRDLAEATGLLDDYEGLYPLMSAASHNSFVLVDSSVGRSEQELSDFAMGTGLLYIALCLYALDEEANLGFRGRLKGVFQPT